MGGAPIPQNGIPSSNGFFIEPLKVKLLAVATVCKIFAPTGCAKRGKDLNLTNTLNKTRESPWQEDCNSKPIHSNGDMGVVVNTVLGSHFGW